MKNPSWNYEPNPHRCRTSLVADIDVVEDLALELSQK